MSWTEADLKEFYEDSYRNQADGEKYGRWRQLGAVAKADHVVHLAGAIGLHAPSLVAEIGCGDGAVLDRLGARGFGDTRVGYEISSAATALAAARAGVSEAHQFDGRSLPVADGTYDLVIASHVLEHVASPGELLQEMARVGHAVVIEVPLEANLSARRPSARAASSKVGHLHRFSRRDVLRLVSDAGLGVRADLLDPLPLAIHLFGRTSLAASSGAYLKWAARLAIARIPAAGERLITLHYALAATRAGVTPRAEVDARTARSRASSTRCASSS